MCEINDILQEYRKNPHKFGYTYLSSSFTSYVRAVTDQQQGVSPLLFISRVSQKATKGANSTGEQSTAKRTKT